MPNRTERRPRRHALRAVAAVLVLTAAVLAPGPIQKTVRAVAPATPTILQEVPAADLLANRNGICQTGATHIIKGVVSATDIGGFVSAAEHCGLKIIWYFSETVDYGTGRVYPSRIAAWVSKVKGFAATFGYMSVKEPSWNGIDATEIRSLYEALKTADPDRPVIALFGDTPNFGTSQNPYTAGMADIVMVDWYPVETTDGRNSIYLTGATTNFPTVRNVVAARTPGVPIYLMVQTHKYTKPTTHKKQRPTAAQLERQVVDGYRYLGAAGIAFHIWRNQNYDIDQYRDPEMVGWMTALIARIEAGAFDYLRPKTSDPDSEAFTRLAGTDRYATAAAISAANYAEGVPVFIATGLNFPDALAGAALAGKVGGPLFLVTRDTVPAATATELARLKPSSITILGSTGVVGAGVEAQLRSYTTGPVTRLAGTDRYATAAAISAANYAEGVPVFIATGLNFPDALAGAALAGKVGGPLFLVTRDTVPAATATELARLKPSSITILGSTGVVGYDVAHAVFSSVP